MAKLDALAEKFYKLIHKLAGDTVSDASAVAGMSINEVCEKLQEEVEDGDLSIASGASTLATLNDTTITSATDGQVLKYNGSKWVNATDTDTNELEDLSDVALTTPSNGQVLTYDGTAGKWKNADASGGAGGSFIVTITSADNAFASDKTLAEINAAYAAGTIPVALMTITNLDDSTYDLAMSLQACNNTIAIFGALYWSSDLSTLNYGAVTVSSEGVVDFSEVGLTIS